MGLKFTATAQDDDVTRRRLTSGQALVALRAEEIVATVTYYPDSAGLACPWYRRPEVGHFGQFGVKPAFQGRGLGSRLLRLVEGLAQEGGKAELALDTSEKALHLIEFYAKKGFREVERVQWEGINYRSVVLSKKLSLPALQS